MRLVTGFFKKVGIKVRRISNGRWFVLYKGVQWLEHSVASMKRRVLYLTGIGELAPLPRFLPAFVKVPAGKRSKYLPAGKVLPGVSYWYKPKTRWVESAVRLAA